MRLGWRSWLVVAALLLWLIVGIGSSWLLVAANPVDQVFQLIGVPLAGVVLPILLLAIIPPAAAPQSMPGRVFARSHAGLLGYRLLVTGIVLLLLLLVPLVMALLVSLVQEAWAADKIVKALFFGLLALLLLIGALASFSLPWLALRPAWQRRRWPFAVIGADGLWIDGRDLAWRDLRAVGIAQMRLGSALWLDTTGADIGTPLFPLAGPGKPLHDEIQERLAAGE